MRARFIQSMLFCAFMWGWIYAWDRDVVGATIATGMVASVLGVCSAVDARKGRDHGSEE